MGIENNYLLKIQYLVHIPAISRGIQLTWPNRHHERLLRTTEILSKIAELQKDVSEVYCDKEVAIKNRMIGLFDGYIIDFINTFDEIEASPYFIKIVFCNGMPEIDRFAPGTIMVFFGEPSECRAGYIYYADLTPAVLKKKVLGLISFLDDRDSKVLKELKNLVGFESEYKRLETSVRASTGYYTRPIIAVLESLRVQVEKNDKTNDYRKVDIVHLVNLFNRIRQHISDHLGTQGMPAAVSYYFTDASSSLDFVNARSYYTEASLRSRGVENPKAMITAIKYSDRGQTTTEDPENPYIAQMEQERLLLDSLIVLAAANHAAPVIRMPLSNNAIYSQVSNLASVDRSNAKKANVMMKKLRNLFAPHLDGWLEYLESSPSSAIKLISNHPLEWAFHQGLPLIVRHEVSRIPVTPGYVTAKLLLDPYTVHLSLEDFREIIFISSFADNDPIRNDLKAKLLLIQSLWASDVSTENLQEQGLVPRDFHISKDHDRLDVRIKWIEVANKNELIAAINNNPCAITVFDLHGSHNEQGAFIHLKDEKVSVFDIHPNIRISPIVILSACDTSPVDKGHDSTAEAFFLAGAKTLISSALPIQSNLASTFLARLLERIKTYLPERVRSEGKPIRWSTFVSGMIRRTYYYELVSLLQKDLGFDSREKMDLLFRIGRHIDPLSGNWALAARKEIMTQLKISADYLDCFVERNVQFLECMKYFQLGRPESILISAERTYLD